MSRVPGKRQVQAVQIDVHHLVRERRADVPAVGAEAVVQLDEVLGARGELDVRRVLHLAEAHDHAGIRQTEVPHQLAGDPLGAQMKIVRVAERHVGGGHAGVEGVDGVVREPFVQRGDRRPHRVQVRVAVLDRTAVRHVRTPREALNPIPL